MERLSTDGVELEYYVRGSGEPVVLIHGALFADGLRPLAEEPALAAGHRVVGYNRIGYGGSSRADVGVTIEDQARHCRSLLTHLGITQAHVVGHSSGAMIALQLACDAPNLVGTLSLLELPDRSVPSWGSLAQRLGAAFQHYADGDEGEAIDTFLGTLCGADAWTHVKGTLPPHVWKQAISDADTYFRVEAVSTQRWTLLEAASSVRQPALVVMGARSPVAHVAWTEGHHAMLKRLPDAQAYVLPGATHLLQWDNAPDLAAAVAEFCRRHPLDSAG